MKNSKSHLFLSLWTSIIALCFIPNSNAQNVSPNIINQKGTPVYTQRNNPNDTVTLEDWHYGGVELDDGGFVFTTRIEQYDSSVNGYREYPGLIKYDKYFNVIWHRFLKPGAHAKIAPFGSTSNIDSTLIEGAEVHTKVIETIDGFVAFGYLYDGSKLFVLKVDKQGKIAPNFPRVFDKNTSNSYQLNDITFVNTNGFKGYLGVGQKNGEMAIFKFDQQLENLTTTMIGNGTNIKGELFGMCLLFPNGSISRDVPKIANEEPSGIAFTGWSDNDSTYPRFIKNFNVYYGAANISLSTINYFKLDHYSNSSSLNTLIPQFSSLNIQPNTNPELTFNFKGFDVCQTQSGNVGGLELWNFMYLSGNTVDSSDRKNGIKPTGSDQLIAGDIYVRELKYNPQNHTLDTLVFGVNQILNNYGHASGADYYPRIALDHDDDFIILTNNSDDTSVVVNHYYLQKIDRDSNSLAWSTKKLGVGPSGICPFELLVTKNGRYVTAGNNYDETIVYDNEDLDIALWGSPCQANAIQNATQFISNVPNGHDFSVQQWSSITPGNPTTMQIGGSGIVGSRIIVEPGFTLKFLGGQGVDLQFPHVEEFGNGIINSPGPLKNIIVYPGGKVIIENGVTLRGVSECGSSWEGIELLPSIFGQPKAELLMGSAEIKEAITAIKTNFNSKISIGSSLGFDAKFTNCRSGIEMHDDNNNTSKIIKAIFDYQQKVEAGFNESLENHIYLNNLNGLNIWGTQFINSDDSSNFSGNYRGTGIKAINSNFNVLKNQSNINNLKECHPPSQSEPPCLFKSLSTGIDAVYLQPNYYIGYPIKVLNNRFEDCRHAMHFGNGNNIVVFENEIFIETTNLGLEPVYQLDGNYGITMNGVSQFQITQNNIQINDLDRLTHGIIIDNSDNLNIMSPSWIYKNQTTALAYQPGKNIALKVNDSCSNLKMNCNDNTNVSTDWYFNPNTNITTIGTQNLEAGNKFAKEDLCTNSPPTDSIDWYLGETMSYYYFNNCDNIHREKPNYQIISGLVPIPIINLYFLTNEKNQCPDSNECHISRWTDELSFDFGGSIPYFPPIPPPNRNYNNALFEQEHNRIEKNSPLLDKYTITLLEGEKMIDISESPNQKHIQLFPNPITLDNPCLNFKNIDISANKLKIFSINGSEIDFEILDKNRIRLKNISQGLYYARISSNNQSFNLKFIISD